MSGKGSDSLMKGSLILAAFFSLLVSVEFLFPQVSLAQVLNCSAPAASQVTQQCCGGSCAEFCQDSAEKLRMCFRSPQNCPHDAAVVGSCSGNCVPNCESCDICPNGAGGPPMDCADIPDDAWEEGVVCQVADPLCPPMSVACPPSDYFPDGLIVQCGSCPPTNCGNWACCGDGFLDNGAPGDVDCGEQCETDADCAALAAAAGVALPLPPCCAPQGEADSCECRWCGDGDVNCPNEECEADEDCCELDAAGNPVIDPATGDCVPDDELYCDGACSCQPKCGNGQKDPGEMCDPSAPAPGNTCPNAGDTCMPDCTCQPLCGNGEIDPGECGDPGGPGGAVVWPTNPLTGQPDPNTCGENGACHVPTCKCHYCPGDIPYWDPCEPCTLAEPSADVPTVAASGAGSTQPASIETGTCCKRTEQGQCQRVYQFWDCRDETFICKCPEDHCYSCPCKGSGDQMCRSFHTGGCPGVPKNQYPGVDFG
jgi:hypothetical protein